MCVAVKPEGGTGDASDRATVAWRWPGGCWIRTGPVSGRAGQRVAGLPRSGPCRSGTEPRSGRHRGRGESGSCEFRAPAGRSTGVRRPQCRPTNGQPRLRPAACTDTPTCRRTHGATPARRGHRARRVPRSSSRAARYRPFVARLSAGCSRPCPTRAPRCTRSARAGPSRRHRLVVAGDDDGAAGFSFGHRG